MTLPVGQVMTVIKRVKGPSDSFGNDTWTEARADVRGVFNPGGSTETVQGQDMLVVQPTVVLPAGTDVAAIDAVEIDGDRYEVDGNPSAPVSPFTNWAPGIVVKLKRVTG